MISHLNYRYYLQFLQNSQVPKSVFRNCIQGTTRKISKEQIKNVNKNANHDYHLTCRAPLVKADARRAGQVDVSRSGIVVRLLACKALLQDT